jgi:hypothetical protein
MDILDIIIRVLMVVMMVYTYCQAMQLFKD